LQSSYFGTSAAIDFTGDAGRKVPKDGLSCHASIADQYFVDSLVTRQRPWRL
jgi:hypothetical protein